MFVKRLMGADQLGTDGKRNKIAAMWRSGHTGQIGLIRCRRRAEWLDWINQHRPTSRSSCSTSAACRSGKADVSSVAREFALLQHPGHHGAEVNGHFRRGTRALLDQAVAAALLDQSDALGAHPKRSSAAAPAVRQVVCMARVPESALQRRDLRCGPGSASTARRIVAESGQTILQGRGRLGVGGARQVGPELRLSRDPTNRNVITSMPIG